ncbi:MAG: ABC transporter ATP-binding protein [Spirochaetaceae bacterium]|nr:MAG: ABC transporter ATP-binding protein [Spirochaetaceae bacterium]
MTEHDNNRITLSIRNLSKIFRGKHDQVQALDDVSLDIREGELFTLLGPSGCGKTTTLRCIAGFEKPSSGTIDFLGRDFTSIPPFRRNIGMVFQSYALFPHLSIYENVAYGLKIRKLSRRDIEDKVNRIIQLVGLEATQKRKPSELSGGQQQRIALARALVYDPQLLLLDEPLSNLDAKLRVYMREEIRRIQQQAKVTTIYVTHDQEEALSISDRIAVMHAGKISQIGSPDEIYENPISIRVADFIGQANFLACSVQTDGDPVLWFRSTEQITLENSSVSIRNFPDREGILFVRPEQMEISADANHPNSLRGEVKVILYLGSVVRYYIEIFQDHDPQEILVDQDRRVRGVELGDPVAVLVHGQDAKLFPAEQKRQLEQV